MIKHAMLAGIIGLHIEILTTSGRQNKYGVRLDGTTSDRTDVFLFKGSSKKTDVFIRGYACAIREAARRMNEIELVETLTKCLGDAHEQQSKT